MVTKSSLIQPPRLAVWLVNLFTPYEQSESILGDLLEEFSDLASKSGMAFARRWYWRQSVRTVAHLIGSGFRGGPWQIAAAVVGGFLLYFLCSARLEQAVVAVLNFGRHPHDNPYYTWSQAQARIRLIEYGDLVGQFLLSLFIGCMVAVAVKGREMVAAITLAFVLWVPQIAWFLVWSARHGPFLPLQLITPLSASIMTVTGAIIVRKSRSAVSPRHSASL
jgi:hypothetical protein